MTIPTPDEDLVDRRSVAGPGHLGHGRLAGRVAIVTGAGSLADGWGNGKATAVLFAREGATVVAVDRRPEAAESTARLIETEGGACLPLAADISREDDVHSVVASTVANFGRLDILQNNVGIGIAKPTIEMSLKEWELVQRVNLTGMFLMIRSALPHMIQQRRGAIVNVSSIASMRWTGVAFASYSASKAGVNQLTRSIALEHAPDGVRCNAVVAGFMDTPTVYAGLAADGDEARLREARDSACPTGRMGDAWDVARASLFLASDESSYITGHLLVVDGGLSIQVGEN